MATKWTGIIGEKIQSLLLYQQHPPMIFVVQHSKTGDITFKASLIDNERFHNAAHLLCLLELLVNEKSLHLYQG